MLAKLFSVLAGAGTDRASGNHRPVRPPSAPDGTKTPPRPASPRQGDGMRRVREEVERALRETGHLR